MKKHWFVVSILMSSLVAYLAGVLRTPFQQGITITLEQIVGALVLTGTLFDAGLGQIGAAGISVAGPLAHLFETTFFMSVDRYFGWVALALLTTGCIYLLSRTLWHSYTEFRICIRPFNISRAIFRMPFEVISVLFILVYDLLMVIDRTLKQLAFYILLGIEKILVDWFPVLRGFCRSVSDKITAFALKIVNQFSKGSALMAREGDPQDVPTENGSTVTGRQPQFVFEPLQVPLAAAAQHSPSRQTEVERDLEEDNHSTPSSSFGGLEYYKEFQQEVQTKAPEEFIFELQDEEVVDLPSSYLRVERPSVKPVNETFTTETEIDFVNEVFASADLDFEEAIQIETIPETLEEFDWHTFEQIPEQNTESLEIEESSLLEVEFERLGLEDFDEVNPEDVAIDPPAEPGRLSFVEKRESSESDLEDFDALVESLDVSKGNILVLSDFRGKPSGSLDSYLSGNSTWESVVCKNFVDGIDLIPHTRLSIYNLTEKIGEFIEKDCSAYDQVVFFFNKCQLKIFEQNL